MILYHLFKSLLKKRCFSSCRTSFAGKRLNSRGAEEVSPGHEFILRRECVRDLNKYNSVSLKIFIIVYFTKNSSLPRCSCLLPGGVALILDGCPAALVRPAEQLDVCRLQRTAEEEVREAGRSAAAVNISVRNSAASGLIISPSPRQLAAGARGRPVGSDLTRRASLSLPVIYYHVS